jgi:very-short-patch-repair endonuclease
MDARVRELAAKQADIVAAWQLATIGLSDEAIKHRVLRRDWRPVHRGVYALTNAPLTRHQRWMAATLTTPDSVLSHASAAACFGFRSFEGSFETVTRPGKGGPRRMGALLVCRSSSLDGDTTRHEGVRITTAARTLIDIASHLDARATGRAFREAIRLKALTARDMAAALERHPTRRRTGRLRDLVGRYSSLPYHRARSDAESRALELLHDAGVEAPRLNSRIAGEEADPAWPGRRVIIEIDGPQYHQFRDEDTRKQQRWEAAGYTVRRIGSDVIYDHPARLIALAAGLVARRHKG